MLILAIRDIQVYKLYILYWNETDRNSWQILQFNRVYNSKNDLISLRDVNYTLSAKR